MSEATRKRPDLRGWVVSGVLLLLWWLATAQKWVDTRLVASPAAVLEEAWQAAASGELWRSLAARAFSLKNGLSVAWELPWLEVSDGLSQP